jgi:hypothetical protein
LQTPHAAGLVIRRRKGEHQVVVDVPDIRQTGPRRKRSWSTPQIIRVRWLIDVEASVHTPGRRGFHTSIPNANEPQ